MTFRLLKQYGFQLADSIEARLPGGCSEQPQGVLVESRFLREVALRKLGRLPGSDEAADKAVDMEGIGHGSTYSYVVITGSHVMANGSQAPHDSEKRKKPRVNRNLAEVRRRSLRQFMDAHDLEPAGWARMAGLPNANSLYNFLNGHSQSLSQETARRLADAVPGAIVSDLFGETQTKRVNRDIGPPSPKLEMVTVKSAAASGVWRRLFEIPSADQVQIPILPLDHKVEEAIVITDRHCDAICPPSGYALISRSPKIANPRDGDICVVLRTRAKGKVEEVEVTLRRLVMRADSKPRLVWVSTDATYVGEIELPWTEPRLNKSFKVKGPLGDYGYSIVGVALQIVMPPLRGA